jgi:hypothetical protein
MAGLKALVIIMGIAIIVAASILVTVMVQRGGDLGEKATRGAIELPAGAKVVESRLDGGRILMRLSLAGGGEQILIIDADSGARLATHDLRTKGKIR